MKRRKLRKTGGKTAETSNAAGAWPQDGEGYGGGGYRGAGPLLYEGFHSPFTGTATRIR